MSKRLEQRLETECYTSRSRDALRQNLERSSLTDASRAIPAPLVILSSNVAKSWSDRYRFDTHSLN
jgi:hypothetical protein